MPVEGVLPGPVYWSEAEAVGLVLDWATALAALRPPGELKAGDVVLVHAGAGGVGQAAVRLARHYGAHVIATASPAKHVTVKALGADEVLDSRRLDLAAEITRLTGGVDLVFTHHVQIKGLHIVRWRPQGRLSVGGGGSGPSAWAVCASAPTGRRRRGRLGGPSLRRSW